MYRIVFDDAEQMLCLTLSGYWSLATLVCFTAELVAKTAKPRLKRINFATLSDSREFKVQSAAVAHGLERIMARGRAANIGPVAIIVGSTLNKLQAERTLGEDRLRVFLDEAEARAWLDAARGARRPA